MLSDMTLVAALPTADLSRARDFHDGTLGLAQGVASLGDAVKAIWFTDPDGNILNISAGAM